MTGEPDRARWQIVTGEYPPQFGGVADYTRLVARGLAARGAEVDVWAPPLGPGREDDETTPGVTLRREAGQWTRADLDRIGRALDRSDPPHHILFQYTPNAFGYKGMNPWIGRWLAGRRRRGDRVRVMFHEVTYIVKPGDRPARRVLAFVQRRLAAALLRAADVVDIGTTLWEPMLRPLDPVPGRRYGWRPVPSNIPAVDDPLGVAAARGRLMPPGTSILVGSFGTFAPDVVALLEGAALPLLLGHPDRAAALIGPGSDRVAAAWARAYPELAGRVAATGPLGHAEVARHIRACDLLLQPYPGGALTKRGSLAATIAQGVATVTNRSEDTEPVWAESGGVALATGHDTAGMAALAEALLADPDARARLGAAGRDLYDDHFDLAHLLDALTEDREAYAPS
jgi:glycosyltransferase involved in cell wall biosynthesis